jgi:hypothetical protein
MTDNRKCFLRSRGIDFIVSRQTIGFNIEDNKNGENYHLNICLSKHIGK